MPIRTLFVAFLASALSCTACGAFTHENRDPSPPPDLPKSLTYEEVADRALEMADSGWIVSRYDDGSAEHLGDSLLWTGLAMGSLDCTRGTIPEQALQTMIKEHGGIAYRHPSLPDEISLDGLLGLWWGISERTRLCPESRGGWIALLPEHAAKTTVEPFFHTVLDQVMADLGLGAAPSESARGRLGAEVATWAFATVADHAAGFRLHLGFLTLSVVAAPKGQANYCGTVQHAKIALLEDFCGRDGIKAWLEGFEYDVWEYQFQRAIWESPDGKPGLHTPAIDWLMAAHRF